MTPYKSTLRAALFIVLAWTTYSITDILYKWLGANYGTAHLMFVSGFSGMVFSLAWLLRRYGVKSLFSPLWKWHLLRGASLSLSTCLCVIGLPHVALADFYGIIFLSPLVVVLLSMLVLKEQAGWARIVAVGVGFAGVLVLAGPSFAERNVYMLLILGAAFLSGCNAIIVRRMGHEKVLPLYPLYPFLFITLGSLPFVFTAPGWPATPLDLGLNMLIGAVSVAGIALYSTAFRIVPRAASIAPFHYIQMVWGVVFGYLLFGDLPGLTTYAGSALIISAGLYVLWHEKRSSRSDALI